jgi:hypothetical protein
MSNADLEFQFNVGTFNSIHCMGAGTLKTKQFLLKNTTADIRVQTISGSVNNPNYEISSTVNFKISKNVVWTRGTGTITLNGGDADINFNSQTVEKVIVNSSGTKTFTAAFTTNAITATAGTSVFQQNVTCENTLENNATITLTPGKTYNAKDVSGNGTFTAASLTYVYYTGSSTFAGTLNNVILVDTVVVGNPVKSVLLGNELTVEL